MRSLVPAETLVYLETNDLAAALLPIVNNKAFEQVSKSKPDFSALNGVQLAVAVTGFETIEEKLTEEHSVGRVQPRFVAVADTHAWNYQAVKFAEIKLGSFVADIFNSEPTLERSDKNGGKYFTWSAKDGRRTYALVIDAVIYFGNDETAIDKCLAVKRGEADSIVKTGKLRPVDPKSLASGYVSTDGVAQIANILGLQLASEAGEDAEVQSAVAGILPQLLRGSLTDVSWTSTKTDRGIEDKYLATSTEVSGVLYETLAPTGQMDGGIFEFLPAAAPGVTVYNLSKPNIAWRSILLTAQSRIDPIAGKMMAELSGAFFEPYGIRDPELFLSGIAPNIATVKTDAEGQRAAVVATSIISENVRRSLLADLKPNRASSEEWGVEIWRSADGDIAAAFVGDKIVAGDAEAVFACLKARSAANTISNSPALMRLFPANATTATLGTETDLAPAIADLVSEERVDQGKDSTVFVTETRFTKTGIERRTVSDFGLIGWIIAQLAPD